MPHRPEDRPSPFPLVVSLLLTGYFAVTAFFLGRDATSEADDAVQHLLWVLVGAAVLVTFCLFLRMIEDNAARSAAAGRRSEDG